MSSSGGPNDRAVPARTARSASALDLCPATAMIGPMNSRMFSGSSLADMAVEPTRSQNITVSCRRSATSGDVVMDSTSSDARIASRDAEGRRVGGCGTYLKSD
jgi:hypothetical protein